MTLLVAVVACPFKFNVAQGHFAPIAVALATAYPVLFELAQL